MIYNHNCLGLLVDDVPAAVDFYTNVMGYGVHELNHDGVTFTEFVTGGPAVLFVWRWSHLEEHLGKEAMSRVKHRVQSAIYFDTVEELEHAYLQLKAAGIDFITELKDWVWNARGAYFVDDEGYMWELYSGIPHPA